MIIKILKFSFLILLLTGIIFPVFSGAVIKPSALGTVAGPGNGIPDGVKIENVEGIVNIVKAILAWIYYIFFIISVIYVILAAFAYLGEGEDAEKLKTIHKNIMWAAIAIAVALLSVGINLIIKNFISP